MECEVWSMECGVWSVPCGVWSMYGIWSAEYVWSMYGVCIEDAWSIYGVWSMESRAWEGIKRSSQRLMGSTGYYYCIQYN